MRSAFAAGADCAFWFDSLTGPLAELVSADPGVTIGAPPADVLARAWCRVTLHGPADLGGLMALADLAEQHGTITTPAVTAISARAAARSRRHAPEGRAEEWSEWLFGRHDRTTPQLTPSRPQRAVSRSYTPTSVPSQNSPMPSKPASTSSWVQSSSTCTSYGLPSIWSCG